MDTQTTSRPRKRRRAHQDPVWIDQRRKDSGAALRLCAQSQQQIARAFARVEDLGSSEGQVSRLCNGDPAIDRHTERVEALASASWTDAGPLAALPFAAMCRVLAETCDDEGLDIELLDAMQRETDAEAEENRAEMRLALADDSIPREERWAAEDALFWATMAEAGAAMSVLGTLMEKRRRRRAGR